MTKEEFIRAWDNHELDLDFAQYRYDNYPDYITVEDFEEYMVTK